MRKYSAKRSDSFKTRYRLFLFEMAFDGLTAEDIVQDSFNSIEEFKKFKIDETLIDAYAANYYQKGYDEIVKYKDYKSLTVNEIWNRMNFEKNNLFQLTEDSKRKYVNEKYLDFYDKLKKSYENIFEKSFPKKAFEEMISTIVCSYCGISEDEIEDLGKEGSLYNKRSETRGYTLEIDRKEANGEYTEENCCMCCYWCNNAKTDEFGVKEFEYIAKGINNIWSERLGKKINFPTDIYSEEKK